MQVSLRRTSRKLKRYLKKYRENLSVGDYRLFVAIIFLWLFGLIMVYSAGAATKTAGELLSKQFYLGIAGLAVMVCISYFDYHLLQKMAVFSYLFAMGMTLLVKVPFLAETRNGATRWIDIGIMFQPSELLKPGLIIYLSVLIIMVGRRLWSPGGLLFYWVPTFFSVYFVMQETKDLSTSIIIFGIAAGLFCIALPGKKIRILLIIGITVMVLGGYWYIKEVIEPLHQNNILQGGMVSTNYRAERVLEWLYRDYYLKETEQSRYGLYAIGFGGIFGRGLGNGTVKYYLSEPANDFIFAVIGEELGIVGCSIVIFLYGYLIWRIIEIALYSRDRLGMFLAIGVGIHFALQSMLNMAVVLCLVPNTGISLPFISHGGTALLLQFAEMGIVLNVSRQIPGKKVVILGEEGIKKHSNKKAARKTA